MKKYVSRIWLLALVGLMCGLQVQAQKASRVVVAYVTSWTDEVPDPHVMTHINYAFGHVNDSFNGVRIDNPERLKMLVGLKQQNPRHKGIPEDGRSA